MKKITLLFALFAFTFGIAQAIPVNFDADITVGDNWKADSGFASVAVENLAANTPDHGNAGKIVSSASGQNWQNAQLLVKDNYIDLTSNKIITLDVYSDNAQDFLLKMEQSKDGTTGNTGKSFSHGGTGWESISVDFNSPNSPHPIPNDQYKLFVIFPCYSAGFANPAFDSTTYIDNFSGAVGDAITPSAVPITDAPTPTHASADVISIYSDAYTDISGVNFNPNWGQSTLVNTSYDPTGSSIQFTPISPGNELLQTVTTTKDDWKSVDIALSNFTNVVLTDVFQLKVVGTGTVYLDNIYLHKPPTAGLNDNVFNAVKMFPNPTKNSLQFSKNSNEQLGIQIFDVLGKSVLRMDNVRNEVNVSELNSGLYFVHMSLGNQKATKKLLIN